jgi:PHD/YefM family antitoxin component YafN of YafNO toxin-antitoxin module
MIATENAQSIAEFRESVDATIERLNQTGEPEYLTVDGQPRAVLLSPAAYSAMAKEYWLSRDVASVRQSRKEIAEGKVQEAGAFFAELRARLLAMKASQENGEAR